MSWAFYSMILKNGPKFALESKIYGRIMGENSATDNPPRPMILIPAHTPSSHAFPLTPSHT